MHRIENHLRRPIQAVILDIGDTLVNAYQIMRMAASYGSKQLHALGLIEDSQDFQRKFFEFDRKFTRPHVNHLYSDLEIVRRTCKALNVGRPSAISGAFLAIYRAEVRRRIKPDRLLSKLLNSITGSGKRLGIISDGTIVEQLETLTRLQILHFFDVIVISEEIGFEKPSVEIFNALITRMGIQPSNMMMVGDNYERDIIGGMQSGLMTALTTEFRPFGPTKIQGNCQPDIILNRLTDLARILDLNPDGSHARAGNLN